KFVNSEARSIIAFLSFIQQFFNFNRVWEVSPELTNLSGSPDNFRRNLRKIEAFAVTSFSMSSGKNHRQVSDKCESVHDASCNRTKLCNNCKHAQPTCLGQQVV